MNHKDVLEYFLKNLNYLKQQGAEFARRYPQAAARLDLQSLGTTDPHVERLLQGAAFMLGRVEARLDDDLPEITEALLGVLQPHALAPIPSLAIARLELDPLQGGTASGVEIARHAVLDSPPVGGVRCRFRTVYPTTLWPLEVQAARFVSPSDPRAPSGALSALEISLCGVGGVELKDLELESLRFYLHDTDERAFALYEHILSRVSEVHLAAPAGEGLQVLSRLPASEALSPVGFDPAEGLLEYAAASSLGQRLLLEYFAFPQKYLFFDLKGLGAAALAAGSDLRVLLYAPTPPPVLGEELTKSCLQLGCTPVVNLFRKAAEPLTLDSARSQYRIVPDRFHEGSLEVFSVEAVEAVGRGSDPPRSYLPLFSIGSSAPGRVTRQGAYWHARRLPRLRADGPAVDLALSIVDLDACQDDGEHVLRVQLWCCNHDLPSRMPFADGQHRGGSGDLHLEHCQVRAVRLLTKPTAVLRGADARGRHWQLVSQLALGQLSVKDVEALREALTLADLRASAATRRQINALVSVECRPVAARLRSDVPGGFVRGLEVRLELDAQGFVSGGAYLLAAVLERCFADSAPLNSFTRTHARLCGAETDLAAWPPRAGEQVLL